MLAMLAHADAVAPVAMAVYETSIRKIWVGSIGGRACRQEQEHPDILHQTAPYRIQHPHVTCAMPGQKIQGAIVPLLLRSSLMPTLLSIARVCRCDFFRVSLGGPSVTERWAHHELLGGHELYGSSAQLWSLVCVPSPPVWPHILHIVLYTCKSTDIAMGSMLSWAMSTYRG